MVLSINLTDFYAEWKKFLENKRFKRGRLSQIIFTTNEKGL
jgi:hypothetical protein